MRASDGSGVDVPLVTSETDSFTVASWSRADVLIFNVFNQNNPSDLWTMSMSGRPHAQGLPELEVQRAQWDLLA